MKVVLTLMLVSVLDFRVVVDPGHGGVDIGVNSDRWDPIAGRYLMRYRPGARMGRIEEQEIVLRIALEVKKLLDFTLTESGWKKFKKILHRYGRPQERVKIKAILTRKTSYKKYLKSYKRKHIDINAPFRLFDYPSETGMKPGRISFINSVSPALVVSIHAYGPVEFQRKGMFAVVSPPYSFLEKVKKFLLYGMWKNYLKRSPYYDCWFMQGPDRSKWDWMLSDTWLYFTGYPKVKGKKKSDLSKWLGYGRNMIMWRYRDPEAWLVSARKHSLFSPFAVDLKYHREKGRYWDRERSRREEWRRGRNEIVGFGGVNHYASDEILRFIRLSLRNCREFRKKELPVIDKPIVSIWAVPILTDSVVGYVEIGNIREKYLRVCSKQIAEGIAVAVYSLLAGLKIKESITRNRFAPRGEKINFR